MSMTPSIRFALVLPDMFNVITHRGRALNLQSSLKLFTCTQFYTGDNCDSIPQLIAMDVFSPLYLLSTAPLHAHIDAWFAFVICCG